MPSHVRAFHAGIRISLTILSPPFVFSSSCFLLLVSHPDPENTSGEEDFIAQKATDFQIDVKYQLFLTSPYGAGLVLTVAESASAQKSQKEMRQVPAAHVDQPGTSLRPSRSSKWWDAHMKYSCVLECIQHPLAVCKHA